MILEMKNIRFNYPGEPELLTGVTLSLDQGDVLCLLGPNGTGKTTLLRCLLGINAVKQGQIVIRGRDLNSMTAKERAREIAYVPQIASTAFPLTVFDMVLMGRNPHLGFMSVPSANDVQIVEAVLEKLGIGHLKQRIFNELSGGERQLTLIARALAQQASLLVMDEPTASLDYGNQVHILRVISELAQQGYTIMMASHFPNHALWACNKAAIMKGGKILAVGSPDDIITDTALSNLYEATIKVITMRIDAQELREIKVCIPILA